MLVILAPSADIARSTLATLEVDLTVEAEYGSYVAEGRMYTAAHHQPVGSPWAGRHLIVGGRPSPCNAADIPLLGEDNIALVSHIDLDTVGGCLRAIHAFADLFPVRDLDVAALVNGPVSLAVGTALNQRDRIRFWDLAEFADVRGLHRLSEAGATPRTLRQLYAFIAWQERNVPHFPRDKVSNVTDLVWAAGMTLRAIFNDDKTLLAAGDEYLAATDALNERTFQRREGEIIVRVKDSSRDFCNHLYTTPDGVSCLAVASYSRESGSVTISCLDSIPGVSCREIVQGLWGPEAGGHQGIAGSPRDKNVGEAGLEAAVQALREALSQRG